MQPSIRVAASCVAACAVLALSSAPALAASAPISGKLSVPGYTVIALASSGEARSVVAQDGSFRLSPPASTVTLHLRAPDGTYAGPIVLAERGGEVARARATLARARRALRRARRKLRRARGSPRRLAPARRGVLKATNRLLKAKRRLASARAIEVERPKRALVGVRAGAALGDVAVSSTAGYALTAPVADGSIDSARVARARRGVPIGAGAFGRTVSPLPQTAVPGDSDADGVPNALDIDDDGDLVLDDFDRSSPARPAQAPQEFRISSTLVLPIQFSVNVNAGSTNEDIEAGLANTAGQHSGGRLAIEPVPGDSPAELDCGALVYCSAGGTGRAFQAGVEFSDWPRFPEAFDTDGDGFGTLEGVWLSHGARSDQIKTGDVLIQRVVREGVESVFTSALQYIFVTGPALRSWSDTAGHSATVSYPATAEPVDVAPGGDGNIVLTFTVWRPQRRRIPADPAPAEGDSPEWTDIGGLTYEVGIAHVEDAGPGGGGMCPPDAFSTADPNLTPVPAGSANGGFVDLATDRPANPANTLTYTMNASRCMEAAGLPWNPGKWVGFSIVAKTSTGASANQEGIAFRRAP